MEEPLVLDADVAHFFETGELPASLTPAPAAPAAPAAPEPPPREPDTAPSSSPPPRDERGRFVATPEAPAPSAPEPPAPAAPAASGATPDTAALAELIAGEASRRAAAEAQLATLQARLDSLTKAAAPPPPDPAADPLGSLEYKLGEITRTLNELRETTTRARTEREENTELNNFVSHIRTLRDAFVKTTPDFDAAYTHLRNAQATALQAAGVPVHEIPNRLLTDELAIARNAVAAGKNPAAVAYDLARRFGYTPAAPQPAPTDRVAAIRAAAEAAKTVERGAAPEAALTPSTIRQASEAQLDQLVQSEDLWAKFTGRKRDIF